VKLFDVYPLYNIELERAEGSYVWDKAGRRYVDLYGGHAVISIGHTHPHFVRRISEQLGRMAFYSNSVLNPVQEQFAEALGRLSGYDDYALFLCNSGAEANENALKLASFHNGRRRVVAFKKAFHGRTEGAVVVTDNPKIIAPVNENPNITFLPLNDIAALEAELSRQDVCAVIVEGIQGVGGVYVPTDEFLQQTRQLCTQYGTALILDEVQSGYGRSGKFFAHQHAGIRPDLISMAKGMGNGFPIGGLLIAPHFKASHGLLGTTFGGNHLACAAGLAVLEVIEQEQLMANAARLGQYLMQQLRKMPGVAEVRGLGLMIGVTLDRDCKEVREALLFEHGIFVGSSSDKYTIRLLPSLALADDLADLLLEKLAAALAKSLATT
jgi:acetylornithine aminotransferase